MNNKEEKNNEDTVPADLRKEIEQMVREDKGLLKKLEE